jgi:catechol 2,3-dioxygenase
MEKTMTGTDANTTSLPVQSHRTPWHIGVVTLAAHDSARLAAFYQEAIGLTVLAESADTITLGVDGVALIAIQSAPDARRRTPREAGLFHTAFLLPSRADLGRWLKHAAARNLLLEGASDHLVSEALYLSDPEGNGIEIYVDRPASAWTWRDGQIAMATERLDLNALAADGEGDFAGMPNGTRIGHIHLQVGDMVAAEAFYGAALGLDLTTRYPGGSFFSSGGYHHHIAANIWHSRGAGARDLPSTGLAGFEWVARDAEILAAAKARLAAHGVVGTEQDGALTVADPWLNALTLRVG